MKHASKASQGDRPGVSPDLQCVHLRDLVLHEHTDPQRVHRLLERIRRERVLKNPPIVIRHNQHFLVLDGATRVTVLNELGLRDIVVQVVDYGRNGVRLETWNHMVRGITLQMLLNKIQAIPGMNIRLSTPRNAEKMLSRRRGIGTIITKDGKAWELTGGNDASFMHAVPLLTHIVAIYKGHVVISRVARTDAQSVRTGWKTSCAMIIFPNFRPAEIRQLAASGRKLPAGITRHIIPGRALRINMPLRFLREKTPLKKKSTRLNAWIKDQTEHRRMRYYQESIFLFDE